MTGWLLDRWLALRGNRTANWFDLWLYDRWAAREQRKAERR